MEIRFGSNGRLDQLLYYYDRFSNEFKFRLEMQRKDLKAIAG